MSAAQTDRAIVVAESRRPALFHRVQTRLIVSFGLLFVVVLTTVELTGIWGVPFTRYAGRKGQEEARTFRELGLVADLMKDRLLKEINHVAEDVRTIANNGAVQLGVARLLAAARQATNAGLSGPDLQAALRLEASYRDLVGYLRLLPTTRGESAKPNIADAKTGKILVSLHEQDEGRSVAHEPFFTGVLKSRESFVGDVQYCPLGGSPVLCVGRAIAEIDTETLDAEAGTVAAVLMVDIGVDDLIAPVLETGEGLGETGEALLVNQKRRIITYLRYPLADGTRAERLEDEILTEPVGLAAQGAEGIIQSEDYRGESVLAAYRHIRVTPEWGWGLVVKRDTAELFAPVRQDIAYSVAIGLVGILAVLGMTVYLARNLTRPIAALSATAERVAAGDRDARATVIGSDEVAGLATTFNAMLHRIGNWHTELEEQVDLRTAELHTRISECKRVERELRVAKKRADAASTAKSEFLANMSHEIRTPLTAMLGFVEEIAQGCARRCEYGSREMGKHLATINRNANLLLQIINDILDLSKIEAGKMTVQSVACRPAEIVAEVTSLVRVGAEAKGLSIENEYTGAIPDTIQSDPTRLRQILINLLGNAIKFTETGGVRLVIRFMDDAEGHRGANPKAPQLQFDVVDTGRGMTEEQVARLFQPFMQADTSTTRQFGGTGLGLVISKRFAEMLGGDVTIVETQEGTGTRVRLTVAARPLEGAKMSDKPMSTTDARADTGDVATRINEPELHGCRILLAEDCPDNQKLIALILKRAGADLTAVDNGKLAVDKALAALDPRREGDPESPFDIILMDMQMPVMDGYEATSLLRQRGYTGPIIALTAHAMAGDRDRCLEAGCDEYTTKPIDRVSLIETIRQHLAPAEAAPPVAI